jgi:tRNA1(Val) A37 N6-methylase TrmN6
MAACLRRRGTLSLILPAASLAEGVAALVSAQCPEVTCIPLWPHADEAARLVVLRGVRLGRGPCVVAPGLVLHAENGFSAAAARVLRDGGSI